MKYLVLCGFVWIIAVDAQPVIEDAENFSIGMILHYQVCDPQGFEPGPAGPNQTWDFSSLRPLPDTITQWMASPSSHPLGVLFPNANLLEMHSDGKRIFISKTANESYLVGYDDTTDAYPPTLYIPTHCCS